MLAPSPKQQTDADVPQEPRIERSFDVEQCNAIVNDPSVRPFIGHPELGPLDMAAIIANKRNIYLACEGGAFLFAADIEVGIYEVHTNFLKGHRGKYALECGRRAARWMFTHSDCWITFTRVPANNPRAANFTLASGFTPRFVRKNAWPNGDGRFCDARFYSYDYYDWLKHDAAYLVAKGSEFHAEIERQRQALGVTDHAHAQEDDHDLYAGACAAMIEGGQPEKGIILYNRWARLAGYRPIELVARAPLVIDIGDAVLQVYDDHFKVVKCRLLPS